MDKDEPQWHTEMKENQGRDNHLVEGGRMLSEEDTELTYSIGMLSSVHRGKETTEGDKTKKKRRSAAFYCQDKDTN